MFQTLAYNLYGMKHISNIFCSLNFTSWVVNINTHWVCREKVVFDSANKLCIAFQFLVYIVVNISQACQALSVCQVEFCNRHVKHCAITTHHILNIITTIIPQCFQEWIWHVRLLWLRYLSTPLEYALNGHKLLLECVAHVTYSNPVRRIFCLCEQLTRRQCSVASNSGW